MDNISKKDISFRLDKLKDKALKINENILKNDNEFSTKYDFAENIGIKVDTLKDVNDKIITKLNLEQKRE